MSYDLFFYRPKASNISVDNMKNYLSNILVALNENGNQWFYQNEETGVYYSFEVENPQEAEDEPEDLAEWNDDFENTGISFNLNFIRASFFGLEAFLFVEKFMNDLNLFIVNPQGETDFPYKPIKGELFENWNKTNIWACKEYSNEGTMFYPIDKSNFFWNYNYYRLLLSEEVGEKYFVSRIFLFKQLKENKVATLATWSEHIPNILPISDYYLLFRKQKKFLRTIEETVLLTRDEFNQVFGKFFEPFRIENTIVIHPDKAALASKTFNTVNSSIQIKGLLEGIASDSIVDMIKEE